MEKSQLKVWPDDSKKIMEFYNILMNLYGEKYGVTSSWFSTDERFNKEVSDYLQQKKEVKEIVKAFRPEQVRENKLVAQ